MAEPFSNPFDDIQSTAPQFAQPGSVRSFFGMGTQPEFQSELERKKLQYEVQQEQGARGAQGEIMKRLGEIQQQMGPDAPPQAVSRALLMDPVFTKNALHMPSSSHAKLLSDIMGTIGTPEAKPVNTAQGTQTNFYRPNTGQQVGAPIVSEDKDVQTLKYLMSLQADPTNPGNQSSRDAALQAYHDFKHAPTDKEKALNWLEKTGQLSASERADWAAGTIKIEPIQERNEKGDVITSGAQIVNGRTNQIRRLNLPPDVAAAVMPAGTVAPVSTPDAAQPGEKPKHPALRKSDLGDDEFSQAKMFNAAGIMRQGVNGALSVIEQFPTSQQYNPELAKQGHALARWTSTMTDMFDKGKTLKAELSARRDLMPTGVDSPQRVAQKALETRDWLEQRKDDYTAQMKDVNTARENKTILERSITSINQVLATLPSRDAIIAQQNEYTKTGTPGLGLPTASQIGQTLKSGIKSVAGQATGEPPAQQPGQQQPPAQAAPKRTPEQVQEIKKALQAAPESELAAAVKQYGSDPEMAALLREDIMRRKNMLQSVPAGNRRQGATPAPAPERAAPGINVPLSR